ncbi:MAG TPA: heavy metal-binding domain-containing protein [Candidatus Saccharimonadales bacterium]|nr:heavy metal-binding domain-containing protein [Candidatus Saccharimonadales bacterium]
MGLFHSDNNQPSAQSPLPNELGTATSPICTGLSGNELYCLALAGYTPGNILMGNSVCSLGVIGGMASNVHTTIGGEIPQYTNMISEGRRLSLQRFEQELQAARGIGAAGVTSEIVFHPGNIEFLSMGSSLYARDGGQSSGMMTSAADGQELFCQVDAGFQAMRLAFGNVAYAIGIGRSMLGSLRQIAHGEVTQYSGMFNITRNLALQRLADEARRVNANSVIGIRTTILPIGVNTHVQEMIMLGTASYSAQLAGLAQQVGGIITSDLTAEEMWNVMRLGYAPIQLVLGTSIYSLGVVGGIKAALRGIAKGEINSLTQLVYGAREQALKKVQDQAARVGADMVLGIKTYIYQLGGDLIEFLAIGTAVKRMEGLSLRSEQLPPQAIIRDKDTFINTADTAFGSSNLSHQDTAVNTKTVNAKV